MHASAFVRRLTLLPLLGAALTLSAQSGPPRQASHGKEAAPSEAKPPVPPPEEAEVVEVPDQLVAAKFDRKGDHLLDPAERKAARAYLAALPKPEDAKPKHFGANRPQTIVPSESTHPGAKVVPADVTVPAADVPLYDPRTVRTVFLDFAESDWEAQLNDFARSDVLVPAKLNLDGHAYTDIGVRFRHPNRRAVSEPGYKRSLRLVLDHVHADQTLGGQHELLLIAPQDDATFVRTLLYFQVARDLLYAPQCNYVRVVLNGEDWGTYLSVQPFDEYFVQRHFGTKLGARWVAQPGATLANLGPDASAYRANYSLQSPEDPAAWAALAKLCQVLDSTPPDQLEAALTPLLDVDGALRFLALENTLVNQSGYWSQASGYGLYLDLGNKFHFVPLEAGTVWQFQRIAEYDLGDTGSRSGGARGGSGNRSGAAAPGTAGDPQVQSYVKAHQFPHQSATDLGMMLSYAFVARADRNDDSKLTRDELLDFLGSWFVVMDEDSTGALSEEQFIAKFRLFITPPSVRDGKSQQTFAGKDAAAIIGHDLFQAIDKTHSGQMTRDQFTGAFSEWFTAWSDPKTKLLTQEQINTGLKSILSQTVFEADQTYIDKKTFSVTADDSRSGPGGGGQRGGPGGGGPGGGDGLSVGGSVGVAGIPLGRTGQGGGGNRGPARILTYRTEELATLYGGGLPNRPLLAKLLAVPALRKRYLNYIYQLTDQWLVWSRLAPLVKDAQGLIVDEVKQETHRPTSYARFVQEIDQDAALANNEDGALTLKSFVTQRHDSMLKDNNVLKAIGAR